MQELNYYTHKNFKEYFKKPESFRFKLSLLKKVFCKTWLEMSLLPPILSFLNKVNVLLKRLQDILLVMQKIFIKLFFLRYAGFHCADIYNC